MEFAAAMRLLDSAFIAVEPVDIEQARIAADAYRRFGKGRHSEQRRIAGRHSAQGAGCPRMVIDASAAVELLLDTAGGGRLNERLRAASN